MLNVSSLSLIIVAIGLAGCQSDFKQDAQPEQTMHASQSVYEAEFQFAQQFYSQTQMLEKEFESYCNASDKSLSNLKRQWHQTMLAWMSLQGQERGPTQAIEKGWKVQFWPDKKNTTGRKMSALSQSDVTWTAEEISEQSVTVQGLGAIEWLLYDSASNLSSDHNTCNISIAIAQNLKNTAQTIAQAWSLNPWQSLSKTAWLSEYTALLSNQLDYSMKKLSRPLAKIGQPRAYFSESWRSKTSLDNLKVNLLSLNTLYLANGKGVDALLRTTGHDKMADRIVNQFERILSTWPKESSVFDMLQTKEGYRNLLSLYNKLEQLKYLIHEEMAIELGVVIGFNATDGD
ncbi:imelysin family protein [Vibrio sagamiensis]|uniref:Iron-regulated protein A n=1 Tax=Vibrio sagamiensis NBRC 104589 TaxID=1219064 RepID=A0A511QBH7_9VIBR|nr:imelysin family protein [Vibrio sagamiensis]PNQ57687.1 iron-regulated protein A [Vibrio agarivorans]GEM74643.1 iron-regulated protein A [Vibrio sagamiensis NBRC 104589]